MENAHTYGFDMIHMEDIPKIEKQERTLLIDLRSAESYRRGHLKNARNFPFEYIDDWREELPDKISLILYCEHGNLSMLAARKLKGRRGPIYTLLGGYQATVKND